MPSGHPRTAKEEEAAAAALNNVVSETFALFKN
jgi:hypothetical protein